LLSVDLCSAFASLLRAGDSAVTSRFGRGFEASFLLGSSLLFPTGPPLRFRHFYFAPDFNDPKFSFSEITFLAGPVLQIHLQNAEDKNNIFSSLGEYLEDWSAVDDSKSFPTMRFLHHFRFSFEFRGPKYSTRTMDQRYVVAYLPSTGLQYSPGLYEFTHFHLSKSHFPLINVIFNQVPSVVKRNAAVYSETPLRELSYDFQN
jgi:hypothetical protein